MAFLDWSPELSVGFEEIDNDHKKLIEMLNALSDAVSEVKGNAEIGQVLDDLLSYTMWHFRHEERLMQTNGYHEFSEHKTQHGDLAEQATGLKKRFEDGDPDAAGETLPFLKSWLANHILGTDKKLGAFLGTRMR
jgi:hemerythrin